MTCIVDRLLWLTIMSIVLGLAVATLLVGYFSLYQLVAMQWQSAAIGLATAGVCILATLQLCQHREDLV